MKKQTQSSVSFLRERFEQIERKTLRSLGPEKGHHFVTLYNDGLDIQVAIAESYPEEVNLVRHALVGTMKELHWFHLLFLTGNYPIIGSRLRFMWELMFRCYYAQTYNGKGAPGPSIDEKMAWLTGRTLTWGAVEAVLRNLLPLGKEKQQLAVAEYKQLWDELNRYAHPSGELLYRMIDGSTLYVRDGFDRRWALATIRMATEVFDLVWLAAVHYHQAALDALATKGLKGKYFLLGHVLKAR